MRYLCVVFLVVAVFPIGVWAGETPDMALAAIVRAVEGNDPETFEHYVDVRGMATQGIDAFVAEFARNPGLEEREPLLDMLVMSLGDQGRTSAGQSLRTLLVEESRNFVAWGVASGSFSGNRPTDVGIPGGGVFSRLFADASTAKKELRVARCQRIDDQRADAWATLFDHGSQRSYPLHLLLERRASGSWRVVALRNMDELVHTLHREAAAR